VGRCEQLEHAPDDEWILAPGGQLSNLGSMPLYTLEQRATWWGCREDDEGKEEAQDVTHWAGEAPPLVLSARPVVRDERSAQCLMCDLQLQPAHHICARPAQFLET
jgi:hypothetical protein